jgi:hypothetical protein
MPNVSISVESAARRVVKGCLDGDSKYYAVLLNFLPDSVEPSKELLREIIGAGTVASIARRVIRRARPRRLPVIVRSPEPVRGVLRAPPSIPSPGLKFDSRRGRRPKGEV